MKVKYIENNGNKYICKYSRRKNSKNITLNVDNNGIIKVSFPYYTPFFKAKSFVLKNIEWIENKIKLLKVQNDQYYYLGKNIRFVKKTGAKYKSFNYIFTSKEIVIAVPPSNKFTDRELYLEWLRLQANIYIPQRVKELSTKYGFTYNSVKIKNLTSRWGSCSTKKILSFNLKLMYFNYMIIDYVIVHELCHLHEMNHSLKFWKLVEAIMPEYNKYKLHLNKIIH